MGNGAKDAPVGGRSCSDSCQAASRAKWPAGSRRRRGAGHPPASSLQHEPVYPSGKVRAAPVGSLSINTFRDMASWLVAARTRISLRGLPAKQGLLYPNLSGHPTSGSSSPYTGLCLQKFSAEQGCLESEQGLHIRRFLMLLDSDTAHLSTDFECLVSCGPRWHRVKIRRRQCFRHFQRIPCTGLVPKWDLLVCSSSSTWLARWIQLKPCRAA